MSNQNKKSKREPAVLTHLTLLLLVVLMVLKVPPSAWDEYSLKVAVIFLILTRNKNH